MTKSFARIFALVALVAFFGAGCPFSKKKPVGPPTGAMWYSPDQGTTWKQLAVEMSSNGIGSWGDADVVTAAFDPEDSSAIYAGTRMHGLLYTYDGGATWQRAKDLAAGMVQAVAVNPKNKCQIFAGLGNRLMRSDDCSRSYRTAFYFENNDLLRRISIDWYDPRIMYAAAQGGSFFKSLDSGASWAVSYRFDDKIAALAMSPKDSRTLLVGLESNGVWKSIDGGAHWKSLGDVMKPLGDLGVVRDIVPGAVPGHYVLVSMRGLFETRDSGESWRSLPLLTPAGSVPIMALAISPKDGKEVYYATDKAFYRSNNGGANWETVTLPTRRAAGIILVHPEETSVIYLGAKLLQP